MVRWEPDARGRLQQAALTLYGEKGFDETTVAEIAERAGLTKRTFFRHFDDKREVLFSGSQELQALFVDGVTTAPKAAAPLDAVAVGLGAVAAMFEGRHEYAAQRQIVVASNPELQERELIKLSTLGAAVAEALRGRGVKDPAAILAAESGITVFRVAFEHWVDPANRDSLERLMSELLGEMRAVTAAKGDLDN